MLNPLANTIFLSASILFKSIWSRITMHFPSELAPKMSTLSKIKSSRVTQIHERSNSARSMNQCAIRLHCNDFISSQGCWFGKWIRSTEPTHQRYAWFAFIWCQLFNHPSWYPHISWLRLSFRLVEVNVGQCRDVQEYFGAAGTQHNRLDSVDILDSIHIQKSNPNHSTIADDRDQSWFCWSYAGGPFIVSDRWTRCWTWLAKNARDGSRAGVVLDARSIFLDVRDMTWSWQETFCKKDRMFWLRFRRRSRRVLLVL